jgi:hypothetical protein
VSLDGLDTGTDGRVNRSRLDLLYARQGHLADCFRVGDKSEGGRVRTAGRRLKSKATAIDAATQHSVAGRD